MKKVISLAILIILIFALSECSKDQLDSHEEIQNELNTLYKDTQSSLIDIINMEGFDSATEAELQKLLTQKGIYDLSEPRSKRSELGVPLSYDNAQESVILSQSFKDMIIQINDESQNIVYENIINDNSFSYQEKRMLIMYLACSDLVFESASPIPLYKSAGPCEDAYVESLENIVENFILAGSVAVVTCNLVGLAIVTIITYKSLDEAEEAYMECLEN